MNEVRPTFFVDAMLGNLAKKLRLFGYNSLYSSSIEDDELLEITKRENRILITKDLLLAEKAKKQDIRAVSITQDNEIEQFFQINEKIHLGKCIVGGNNSRCSVCNGELSKIEKNNVLNKVPEGVFENLNDFWSCKKCGKIYWEGTHIKNLQRFTYKLNERIS